MSAGLFALLDDVAVLARLAAASIDDIGAAAGRATVKAAGVVVDDTAVTPQYVHGLTADRELPIIKRIAIGSLRNKLVFILPAALLLSQFLPQLLTPILMLGATYLCFEGAEKVLGVVPRSTTRHAAPVAAAGEDAEKQMTAGAIRTDFILSAEIMVIALNEVADQSFWPRLIILAVVAVVITAAVYGVVARIVKMDDVGLASRSARRSSRRRSAAAWSPRCPNCCRRCRLIGTVAMLWVGGHILLIGTDTLGWHAPYGLVHHVEDPVHRAVARCRRRAGLAGQHRGLGADRLGRRRRRGGGRARAAVRHARSTTKTLSRQAPTSSAVRRRPTAPPR